MRRPQQSTRSLVAALCLLVAGCTAAPPPGPVPTVALPDSRPTGPLPDLPDCDPAPEGVAHDPIEGLVLPDEAVVTEVAPVDPVVNVLGYVPLTPSQFRRTYEAREGITLLTVEDETYDSEVLLTTGTHRVYIQALAVCTQGSRFGAVIASEADAGGVPVPPGQHSPSPSG